MDCVLPEGRGEVVMNSSLGPWAVFRNAVAVWGNSERIEGRVLLGAGISPPRMRAFLGACRAKAISSVGSLAHGLDYGVVFAYMCTCSGEQKKFTFLKKKQYF